MSADLRRRIAAAEAELQSLREQLAKVEAEEQQEEAARQNQQQNSSQDTTPDWPWPLQADEYDRYARQLILPGVGVQGQLRLKSAKVVIIGAGGLGCPASLYLAGAGVGHMVLVDGDTVETSNLHRQVAHTTARVGQYKVDSLVAAMRARNPSVKYTVHREHLTTTNVARILGDSERSEDQKSEDKNERSEDQKDVTLVLDCTDHPAIRYLISDACVRAGIPLVSAAALRTDGQLTVLNWPPDIGPCYRCVFPKPPPAASQTSCAEGGVLGPVVGVMGVLQALEAIRVLVSDPPAAAPPSTLTLFSAGGAGGLVAPTFRTVRLKGRRNDCFACSEDAPLKKLKSLGDVDSTKSNWPDYVQFCGGSTAVTQHILQPDERVSVTDFQRVHGQKDKGRRHWLLDVREKEFYNMGSIPGAINIPFSQTQKPTKEEEGGLPVWLPEGIADDTAPIYLVCRVGNDSQVVTRQLKTLGLDKTKEGTRFVGDVEGGLLAWKRQVDSTMPFV